MRFLCSSGRNAWKRGGYEGWVGHHWNRAHVALRPRRASLQNEGLLSRVHSARREDFNSKSRRRNDSKRFLAMPIRVTKKWMLLLEPIELPAPFGSWRLGVKNLPHSSV
jgi:hypothetical protein